MAARLEGVYKYFHFFHQLNIKRCLWFAFGSVAAQLISQEKVTCSTVGGRAAVARAAVAQPSLASMPPVPRRFASLLCPPRTAVMRRCGVARA